MQRWETVTIVGVGLIGASIGLALRKRQLATTVVGVGRRASSLRKARQIGAVTSTTTDLSRGVRDAHLVIICTPVERIATLALEASQHCQPDAIITDAGSTKLEIVRLVETGLKSSSRQIAFVGSHPMAGSEKNGPEFGQANLFEGRVTVVTPSKQSKGDSVDEVERLWKLLGSKVVRMSPKDHDRSVAAISHMPHLVASAIAAATPPEELELASTGWLDTTRIASGDPELWRQILIQNRGGVLKSLDKFEKVLATFRQALERDQQEKLLQLLEAGKQRRDSLGN
ncbi:MAG: prephenate dehydrogenase/arogenate dehydrogenase family protein [Planctomycetaceae bacterium]|nr:prephenate dehydrogenase/arogenate dehydrogenase family protein [Planctomycetales bacterium]MCB9874016.1 prephenate dehydrogenase/arogenate dehydrogenase family protein [Planctomycetaceae bacterium]MCB9941214.1 prephenate dehydrogenase/arogenate dehydrogenase family protein [Planctomycetaceae bacterium]HRX77777.1 prephenate dehydrogenase/arogenate dehydrogenase family protein [Pirellulaceae bacterium]